MKGFTGGLGFTFIVMIIAGIAGWITNIINVVATLSADEKVADVSTLFIAQIIGIPMAPLGAVLGVVSWF